MKEAPQIKTFSDYGGLLRRRWRYPAMILPSGILLAIFLAYTLPVSYESKGAIMEESPSLPSTMVPTTVAGHTDAFLNASEQLELTRRRVMTKEELLSLVKHHDLYPDQPQLSAGDKAALLEQNTTVERVDPVTLEPREVAAAFSISYFNADPKRASAGANALVNLFLTHNRRTRAEQAAEALKFLQAQAFELAKSLAQMESKLADFKGQHGSSLPDAQGRNLVGIDRAQRDAETYDAQIRAGEERESALMLQLSQTAPSLTAAVGDWPTALAQARAELAIAEQKYTPEHPDVKRLRRAVADLVAQGAVTNKAGAANPDNPAYLVIQNQLVGVRRELAASRANAARARTDLSNFERNLATTPSVEREYVELTREYGTEQARYADLQQKIKQAALAQTLESEARGERFTLVRSPG